MSPMTRFRLLLCAAVLSFAFTMTLATAPVQTAPAAGHPPPQAVPPTSPGAVPAAEFVGSDTCLGCHEGLDTSVAKTSHGRVAHPRSPAAAQGCESCHGPGSRHLDDPSDDSAIRKFATMAPRDTAATCRSCHTSSSHALWEGSAHDARNMSCATCHSVHAPAEPKAQLVKATELDLCGTCHQPQALKIRRVAHMPVPEGKMACSTCHNPHGATNVRQLRTGNWINESCVSCHTEKRGPFLFEHAAGRECCVSCHDPHGSSNDRMLVAKAPMLCQRCHIGTRHPSTMYDGLAVQNRSNRIIGRACINCHQQIHGSNHPSGQSLTR
jgi:DmsE family decaheme c-type cytochrome